MFKGNSTTANTPKNTKNPKNGENNSPDRLNRIVDGTSIEGEIISDSNIRIDGTVRGTVSVKGKLVVGATGVLIGDISCENAEIEGHISGSIVVNGLLSLKASAKLECDIVTQKLAIEPGAVFTGACTMSRPKETEINQRFDRQPEATGEKRAQPTT